MEREYSLVLKIHSYSLIRACHSDLTKYDGPVYYAPSPNPSQYFQPYFVNATIQYGSADLPFPTKYLGDVPSGIWPITGVSCEFTTDGTSILMISMMLDQYPILLPTAAYNLYANLTGGVPDPNTINLGEDPLSTKWLRLTHAQFLNLKPFHVILPGHPNRTLSLSPDAQIWPRKQNYQFNGTKDGIYLAVHRVRSQNILKLPIETRDRPSITVMTGSQLLD